MPLEIQIIDSWICKSIEPAGAKTKSWYVDDNKEKRERECEILYLYKEPKEGTGEDWAEVIAFQLACSLELPCAEYRFASLNGRRGVISPKFLPPATELIEGTELITEIDKEYERRGFFKRSGHTVEKVAQILNDKKVGAPIGYPTNDKIKSGLDVFIGYLLLDALIGNGDRHDQNWAIVRLQTMYLGNSRGLYLAPTFDHAASLGRELAEETKLKRLTTKDKDYTVKAYLKKNRSAFYRNEADAKPMHTLEAFELAGSYSPAAANFWLSKLASIQIAQIQTMFESIPSNLISKHSISFARELLLASKENLMAIRPF